MNKKKITLIIMNIPFYFDKKNVYYVGNNN